MSNRIQPPECAICGHPVESFSQTYDVLRRMTVFVAQCHGQMQRVELADYQIHCAGPHGITVERAFEFTAIAEQEQ